MASHEGVVHRLDILNTWVPPRNAGVLARVFEKRTTIEPIDTPPKYKEANKAKKQRR
jgi:hypothetical protein